MKKIISGYLVLVILLTFPVSAFAESTTISVEVPDISYQLVIPDSITIDFGDPYCALSVPSIASASGLREGMGLKVSISYPNGFTSPNVSTIIPFTFSMDGATDWPSGACLYFYQTASGRIDGTGYTAEYVAPSYMTLYISPEAWAAALPGRYSATITYQVSFTGL